MLKSVDPEIAVFDANSPPCLAFVRSLGRRDIPVKVYSHDKWAMTRFSKYTKHFGKCPDVEDPSRFMPWLKNKLENKDITLIAPTTDAICFYIAEYRDLFPDQIRSQIPDREQTLNVLFKDRFQRVCAKSGLETPKTFYPNSQEEAMDMAPDLPYPVILKPRSHIVAGLWRGYLADDAEQFRKVFRAYSIGPSHAALAERYPEQVWPMVQERIEALQEQFVSISGLLANPERFIAVSSSQKDGQWPPGLGVGTSFKCYNDSKVIEIGMSMVQNLIDKGLFELEIVYDKTRDSYVPIDLNPRLFGQVSLDIARGNDLPYLWYQTMMGETISEQPEPRNDIQWRHGFLAPLEQLARLRKSSTPWIDFKQMIDASRRPHVDVLHDSKDPLPGARAGMFYLRHMRGTVRFLWTQD